MATKHIDLTGLTTVVNDITTKADLRFLKVDDVDYATTQEINALKASIWPVIDMTQYSSSSVIPWDEFEDILDNNIYDNRIVGARVTDSNNHNWLIIKAGNGYYDLFYNTAIQASGNYQYGLSKNTYAWKNSYLRENLNGSSFYNNTSLLPANMKSRVISKEVHADVFDIVTIGETKIVHYETNITDDNVWILTATEAGAVAKNKYIDYDRKNFYVQDFTSDDGQYYSYFDNFANYGIQQLSYGLWTATTGIYNEDEGTNASSVSPIYFNKWNDGEYSIGNYSWTNTNRHVSPCIRVS